MVENLQGALQQVKQLPFLAVSNAMSTHDGLTPERRFVVDDAAMDLTIILIRGLFVFVYVPTQLYSTRDVELSQH